MRTSLGLLLVSSACANATAPAPVAAPTVVTVAAVTSVTTEPIARQDLSAPWSLTASDGSGLVLTRVDAKAVVEGPLAFTELHLWFHNTEPRQREGQFQITLPQGAAVSRFAMENAGQWMEAEVVPKLVARRAYEDFLHRRQDPALLEKAAGNQFTARVFPIFANADKHLVISYSQELPGVRYTLPLRGLPRASRVDVELAFEGKTEKLSEREWMPDRDFVSTVKTSAAAVGAGGWIAAQVELGRSPRQAEAPRGITLLVDTSASRALGFKRYVAAVKKLVGELRATWGDALPLQVVAFDQETQLVFEGRIADAQLAKLVERGAAGASNVEQAIAWVTQHGTQPRVVIVGDGVITAGAEHRDLQLAVKRLANVERVDVVLTGGLRDDKAAAALVRSLPRAGAVLDLETDAIAAALAEPVLTNVVVDVPGATWVYPRTIESARAGTKVMVFARLPAVAPSIDVIAAGVRHSVRVLAGTEPLVARAVASAELDELEASLALANGDAAKQIRTQIAQKSVATRVLSRETSLLVLESESDYPRYGIDRKALADVLVVGARGVERVRRSDITKIPTRVARDRPTDTDTVEPRAAVPSKARVVTGDTDHDAIVDVDDRCPSEPESYNGMEDDDGCPDRGRVVMTSTSIEILEPVHFHHGSALIQRASFPILDAVAATLLGNPDIQLIELQGHTDERGDDANNLALSERRANAVREYMIKRGVAPQRLLAQGYGETQPLDRHHNERAWAKNRRTDFLILRRDGSGNFGGGKGFRFDGPPPLTGELADVKIALAAKQLDVALAKARAWHAREPGNVLALIGLGETLEAMKQDAAAARMYGSIIDLFPGRADLRRFAGERLARLATPLAIDTFRRAVADRPDHLTGHRLLAYALVRANQHADAFAAILAGLGEHYREGSFRGAMRVLAEDAAMIGTAYANAVPAKRAEIVAALATRKLALATQLSTRFVAYWETDANDVDLHVTDGKGGHASYQAPRLPSGGELYADITNGYGPECFSIAGKPTAGPYHLSLHYYAQGPMGYGMGVVQIQTFDPTRGFTFDDRPYVIMTPHAKVDLGTVR